MIYAYEMLAYYLSMKPKEFWDSTYREVILYCQMSLMRIQDDFRNDIVIQEAMSDKLLMGDAMREKPKILPLKKKFKEIFKK